MKAQGIAGEMQTLSQQDELEAMLTYIYADIC
jgi:hypothetical protein